MNYVEQLNHSCRRFWRDESGVVLAFTVIVFLTLFVIACSVYAVGEHIRQRIELQNAADAAAYSAAVVQADTLSRIAAINKALAWTHVQMGRAVMDYDVDVWLKLTLDRFEIDFWTCWAQIIGYTAPVPTYPNSWIGSNVGWFTACQSEGNILINNNQSYPQAELKAFWLSGPHWQSLQGKIDTYRSSIIAMNQEESSLIGELKGRIEATVQRVLQQNAGYPDPQDYLFTVLAKDGAKYFSTLDREDRLLRFFDTPKDATAVFQDGIDVWFKKWNFGGIQRRYVQQGSSLRADWKWHLEGWDMTPDGPVLVYSTDGSDTVRGSDGMVLHDPTLYYQTETVKAHYLTPAYFQSDGAIAVAVARRMVNPLSFLAADPTDPGLFGFFAPATLGGKSPYAWAAAASRAGYRDGSEEGAYNPTAASLTQTSPEWLESRWNLSQWDWDAELIPLPWVTDAQQLWSSGWKPLYGNGSGGTGLGSYAGGPAPSGKFLH